MEYFTHLTVFRSKVQGLSGQRFADRFPTPFLLIERHVKETASGFSTISLNRKDVVSAATEAESAYDEPRVYLVKKTNRNSFQNMISIGRSSNCDIVIDHASISKLHAYFKAEVSGDFSITDAGSKNRTFIEEFPLVENKPIPIKSGHSVRFGESIRGTFFLPTDFHAFLEKKR